MNIALRYVWVTVAVMAAALLPRVAAAQVSVSAGVSADRVYVGDGLRLEVEVGGAKNPDQPTIPQVPGLLIESMGGRDDSRHSITIINGRRSEESFEGYVFSFRVLASKAGRFTIPPISVMVDGKTHKTDPVSFVAVEPGEATGFKLTLEAEKKDVYVGEPVRVRLTWYLLETAQAGQFSMPATDGAFELLAAPAPAGMHGQEFTLFGKPATAVQGRGELDGEACQTISIDQVFVARRAGEVTMGPVRLAFDSVINRGVFGRTERKVIRSNALVFDVKPLPEPQPAGFTGLVGVYRIETRASATDVHVGDPITLTVMIYGPEPLEAVPALEMSDQPALAGAFRTSGEPLIPSIGATGDGRAAVYTATIRAESDNVREIPALELAYFDVNKGKYGVARSKPIPLKVRPTTEVGLPADVNGDSSMREAKSESVGGLAPIVKSPEVLTQGAFDLVRSLRSPAAIGVLGAPALLYLGSVGVVALRRRAERDPARRRRHGAPGRALRRLARAARRNGGPTEIGGALRGFVADWFDLPEAGITSAECVECVGETGVDAAPRLASVLERCDSALFGGSGAAVDTSEAQELVRTLTRELEVKA